VTGVVENDRRFAERAIRGGPDGSIPQREESAMSDPNSSAAGDGVSDEEMVQTVAEQTDSASENADTAGKDWNGDPASAPDGNS
jgi:NACalpha-BTF3-like transcription factor